MKNKIIFLFILMIGFVFINGFKNNDSITKTNINRNDSGRIFEGLGGVSAGASSELLIDYPEPQRSDIIDYLFKPKFGASLHLLKVEIGADKVVVGSEPSHARSIDELKNPKAEYYQRGYEYWLMKEAQNRNPEVILGALEWTIPAYLTSHWTQENADYIVQFIKGAKDYWNVNIDFISPGRNECAISIDWLKNIFEPTMQRAGLQDVAILAPDDDGFHWEICNEMLEDTLLKRIVDAVGYHYVLGHLPKMDFEGRAATENAKRCGASLWASEDWWMIGGSWPNAHLLVGIFNKMYIRDRITCMQIWCPFDGYYDNLGERVVSTGLMKADQPWTGYYEVSPAIWAAAHVGQFVQPGWRFMDSACGYLGDSSGGNYVTLQDTTTGDYSIIVYTDSVNHRFSIKTGNDMSQKDLHVWQSTENEQFVYRGVLKKEKDVYTIPLEPNSVYSLTTTTGQQKGMADTPVPDKAPFPLPYSNNFEDLSQHQNPKYFADVEGAFEVQTDDAGGNKFVEQVITEEPLEWIYFSEYKPYSGPLTTMGDTAWSNISISADVYLGDKGEARIVSRIMNIAGFSDGYALILYHNGYWELIQGGQNTLGSGKIDIGSKKWHNLKLSCIDDTINCHINNRKVKSIRDDRFKRGMVAFGTNWENVRFDNVEIE
jgi:galactosylceramidase